LINNFNINLVLKIKILILKNEQKIYKGRSLKS